jgi:hypothetical protein
VLLSRNKGVGIKRKTEEENKDPARPSGSAVDDMRILMPLL